MWMELKDRGVSKQQVQPQETDYAHSGLDNIRAEEDVQLSRVREEPLRYLLETNPQGQDPNYQELVEVKIEHLVLLLSSRKHVMKL